MVRIAVETMVWSSAARNMPSIRPDRISMICRYVRGPDSSVVRTSVSAMIELLPQFVGVLVEVLLAGRVQPSEQGGEGGDLRLGPVADQPFQALPATCLQSLQQPLALGAGLE